MAHDNFVYWTETPPRQEVEQIVENFFGGAAVFEKKESHWMITLPGSPTHPLEYIVPSVEDGLADERWIEVWFTGYDECIDIATRHQDDFTKALAKRLAERIAAHYQAQLT